MNIADLINKALMFLDNRLTKLGDRIEEAVNKAQKPDFSVLEKITATQASQLIKAVNALENKKVTFDGVVKTDNSEIVRAIKDIRLEQKDPDLSVQKDIKNILFSIQNDVASRSTGTIEAKLDTVIERLSNIKLSTPDTIKLDDGQLKALKLSMGGGGGGGPRTAMHVTLANVALTASNTQYSYTFPPNTLSWTIKLRDQGTLGYYSFTTGKMPAGGDSTNYATIPQNFLQGSPGVEWSNKTIYLGAESNTQVAEITSYQL